MPETNGAPPTNESLTEFETYVRRLLGTMVGGLTHTAFGLPIPLLLAIVAKQAGFVAASSMVADLANNMKMRKLLKDAFAEGIQQAPMNLPPAPQEMSAASAKALGALDWRAPR